MFKGLANLAQIIKQAQEAQSRMSEMKERLGLLTVQGAAGGGLVMVEMNGRQEVLSCRIDESLLRPEDREVIEDLVVSATNEALRKVQAATASEFSQLAGGLDLGAMKDALGDLGLGGGN
jgi:nucleoid-associated protein EbfC